MSRSRSRSAASSASKKSGSASSSLSRSRSRSRSQSSDTYGYRLHIADIGDDCRKIDLERCFAPYGELKEVWMTNSRPCFGFAVYKNKSDAAIAVKECDGIEVAGSRIRVSYARPRTRGLGRRSYSNNMRCYQCGANGHFYRDCPEVGSRGGGGRYRGGYGGGGGGGGGGGDRETDRFGRERRRSERDRDRDSRRKRSRRDSGDYGRSRRREDSGRRSGRY